ncbi:hypothetical protein [Oscillibacter sp. 1-3]|uniref:hypothetical protein n=1 Tax=Oscillibacter sp. 1-3 TaxID=1235797 RepID=UPI0003394761|nr:hypothetical protein [Oscillibacter sp. 1-3]EOS62538.1 hypothetical protein C816_04191 [Oscillibacter sp. 1-3]
MSESNRILYPRATLEHWLGRGASQSSYNLDEFLKLIEPTYQVYEEYIRRCVAGLTTVAAQRAVLHQEEDITKLREIILKLVPFWGLDGGAYADKETSIQLERQYRESFDQAVSAARRSGLPDSSKKDILIALEIHRQELKNDGELDNWIEECVSLQRQLRSEWQMDADAPRQQAMAQIRDSHPATPAMEGMS